MKIQSCQMASIQGSTCVDVNSIIRYSTSASGTNYNWSINKGTILQGQGTPQILVRWDGASAGETGDVSLNIDDGADTTSLAVTIQEIPNNPINGPTESCLHKSNNYSVTENDGSSYQWSVQGGGIEVGQGTNAIVVNWESVGTFKVRMNEVKENGCETSSLITVSVNDTPLPGISGATDVDDQAEETYSVSSNSGSSYSWSVSGGTIQSGDGTNSITVKWGTGTSGTVEVTENNSSGCVGSDSLSVTIHEGPSPQVTGSEHVYEQSEEIYSTTDHSGSTYNWTVNGGTIKEGQGTTALTVVWGTGSSGTVQVEETDSNGYSSTDSLSINIYQQENENALMSLEENFFEAQYSGNERTGKEGLYNYVANNDSNVNNLVEFGGLSEEQLAKHVDNYQNSGGEDADAHLTAQVDDLKTKAQEVKDSCTQQGQERENAFYNKFRGDFQGSVSALMDRMKDEGKISTFEDLPNVNDSSVKESIKGCDCSHSYTHGQSRINTSDANNYIAQQTSSHEMNIQLNDDSGNDNPVGDYQVQIKSLDKYDNPTYGQLSSEDAPVIDNTLTDKDGQLSSGYDFLDDGSGNTDRNLHVGINDPYGNNVSNQNLTVSIGDTSTYTVNISATTTPVEPTDSISDLHNNQGLPLPTDLDNYLAIKNISTLDDIRGIGGLLTQNDFPDDQASIDAAFQYESHADLELATGSGNFQVRDTLISNGFNNISIVGGVPFGRIFELLKDFKSRDEAEAIQKKAKAGKGFINSGLAGALSFGARGQGSGLAAFSASSQNDPLADWVEEQCRCEDCNSAVSPVSYYHELIRYVQNNFKADKNGDGNFQFLDTKNLLNYLKENLAQPFDTIITGCADNNKQYCKIQLSVETLRNHYEQLDSSNKNTQTFQNQLDRYLKNTYQRLLDEFGVDYEALREVQSANNEGVQELAETLQIPANKHYFNELFFDLENANQLSEVKLEELFGIPHTAKDLRNRVTVYEEENFGISLSPFFPWNVTDLSGFQTYLNNGLDLGVSGFQTNYGVKIDGIIYYCSLSGVKRSINTDKDGMIYGTIEQSNGETQIKLFKDSGKNDLVGSGDVYNFKYANQSYKKELLKITPNDLNGVSGEILLNYPPSSTVDFKVRALPKWLVWQQKYLLQQWFEEDHNGSEQFPAIDPTVMGPANLRNLIFSQTENPYNLWQNRFESFEQKLQVLNAAHSPAPHWLNPQIGTVNSMDIDNNGDIFVLDEDAGLIKKIGPDFTGANNIEDNWIQNYGNGILQKPEDVLINRAFDHAIYIVDSEHQSVLKLNQAGVIVDRLYKYPITQNQYFSNPKAITKDDSGNLYVADAGAEVIFKFSHFGGDPIKFFEDQSVGDVHTMVSSPDYLFFSTHNSDVIQQINHNDQTVNQISDGSFSGVKGIALDNSQDLYIANSGDDDILKVESGTFDDYGGSPSTFSSSAILNLTNLVYDPNTGQIFSGTDGNGLWVSDNNADTNYPTFSIQELYGISNVKGHIFITDSSADSLIHLNKNGKPFNTRIDSVFSSPKGVSAEEMGEGSIKALVADSGNHRLSLFNLEQNDITHSGDSGTNLLQFSEPFDVALGQEKGILVADTGNDRIQKLSIPDDYSLANYPAQGYHSPVKQIAVDGDGYFYVTDIDHHQVQKFDPAGNLVLRIGGNLEDELIGRFPFDDGNATDVSEAGNNGSDKNVTYDDGRGGQVAVFDRRNQSYIIFNNNNNLFASQVRKRRTISFWFYADNKDLKEKQILVKEGDESNGGIIAYLEAGSLYLGNWNNSNKAFTKTEEFNSQQWHHLFIVLDKPASEFYAFLDGELVDEAKRGFELSANRAKLVVGGNPNIDNLKTHDGTVSKTHYFQGKMDDLRIWDRSLTVNEANVLANDNPSQLETFKAPYGVAVDSEGNIWALDTHNNNEDSKVKQFNFEGNLISKWGETGSNSGKLKEPVAIQVFEPSDGIKEIFIADKTNNRIERFSDNGDHLESFGFLDGVELYKPTGLTIDNDGSLYIADFPGNNDDEFDYRILQTNAERDEIKNNWNEETGLTETRYVQITLESGKKSKNNSKLWLTNPFQNTIEQPASDENGEIIIKTENYQWWSTENPSGIYCVGEYIYFASFNNDSKGLQKIQAFTAPSEVKELNYEQPEECTTWSLQLKKPKGVTWDKHGDYWVADTANHRIIKLDSAHNPLVVLGKDALSSPVAGNEQGEFNTPQSVACDIQNNLWVVDTGNNRLQKFKPDGTFIYALSKNFPNAKSYKSYNDLSAPAQITLDDNLNLYLVNPGNSGTINEVIQKDTAYGIGGILSRYRYTIGNIASSSLVADYAFEGNLKDGSDEQNHGQGIAYAFEDARTGQGLSLSNDESHVTLPAELSNTAINKRSISFWFYSQMDSDANQEKQILFKDGDASASGLVVYLSCNKVYAGNWENNSGNINKNFFRSPHIENENWYHVILLLDAANNTFKFYLNGTLIGTKGAFGLSAARSGIMLGQSDSNLALHDNNSGKGVGFKGLIDELKIWNKPITLDEINLFAKTGYWAGDPRPFNLHTLVTLLQKESDGKDITKELNQLHLNFSDFRILESLMDSAENNTVASNESWQYLERFFAYHEKVLMEHQWLQEEKEQDISLGPVSFKLHDDYENTLSTYDYGLKAIDERRERWQDKLNARIGQYNGLQEDFEEKVENAREDPVKQFRDGLILASEAPDGTLREKAEWLGNKLLIDLTLQCCSNATRISYAIATLQNLLWQLKTGFLADQALNVQNHADNLEEDWRWLGSYRSWKSLMFMYIYPENLMLPQYKRWQTPLFKDIVERASNVDLTEDRACDLADEYYKYIANINNLRAVEFIEANDFVVKNDESCGGPVETKEKHQFYFAIGDDKIYYCTKNLESSNEYALSFWEPVPKTDGAQKVIGVRHYYNNNLDRLYLYFYADKKLKVTEYPLDSGKSWDEPKEVDIESDQVKLNDVVQDRLVLSDDFADWIMPRFYCFVYVGERYVYNPNKNNFLPFVTVDCFDVKEIRLKDEKPASVEEVVSTSIWNERNDTSINRLLDLETYNTYQHFDNTKDFRFFAAGILGGGDFNWNRYLAYRKNGVYYTAFFSSFSAVWPQKVWTEEQPDSVQVFNVNYKYDQKNPLITFGFSISGDGKEKIKFKNVIYRKDKDWLVPGPDKMVKKFDKGNNENPVRFFKIFYAGYDNNLLYQVDKNIVSAGYDIHTYLLYNWQPINIKLVNQTFNTIGDLTKLKNDQLANAKEREDAPRPIQTYLEEAYYFLPMFLGQRLQLNDQYQAALEWFRTIYDYTAEEKPVDADNKPRHIYYGLDWEEDIDTLMHKVEDFLLEPYNPHSVAGIRVYAYKRYTMLSIAKCLNQYADAEFTNNTVSSVDKARKLYQRALELLESPYLLGNKKSCEELISQWDHKLDEQPWQILWQELQKQVSTINDHQEMQVLNDDIKAAFEDSSKNEKEKVAQAYQDLALYRDTEPSGITYEEQSQSKIDRSRLGQVILSYDKVLAKSKEIVNGVNLGSNSYEKASQSYIPEPPTRFCMPDNPVISIQRFNARNNLEKIRNCLNIAGVEVSNQIYGVSTGATSGIPVASLDGTVSGAGGVPQTDLPYRYEVLINRAKQLTNLAQNIENQFLAALEKRDRAQYSIHQAEQDLELSREQVELQDLRVEKASEEISLAIKQRERAQIKVDHYSKWLEKGNKYLQNVMGLINQIALVRQILNAYRTAGQVASSTAAALSAAASATNTKSAIGAAAAASYGIAAEAQVRAGITKGVLIEKQRAIKMQRLRAARLRRERQWKLQKAVAKKNKEIANQRVTIAETQKDITEQQKAIAELKTEQAEDTIEFLSNQFTNADLYEWMSEILKDIYRYFLQEATSTAKMAMAQLAFQRQETPPRYIQSDYWQTNNQAGGASGFNLGPEESNGSEDRQGLTGSARLLRDIYKLDQFAFEEKDRKLNLTKTISLANEYPSEFAEFLQTGTMTFETPEEIFDYDYPGHYLRLIRKVRVSVLALIPPQDGIKATLTNNGLYRVTVEKSRGYFAQNNGLKPPQSVALTSPQDATGLFELQEQKTDMFWPFENIGVDTSWEFRMPHASNNMDYGTIADVLFTVEYTALQSFDYREKVQRRLSRESLETSQSFSLKDDFPDQWYDLHNPEQSGGNMTVNLNIYKEDLPTNHKDEEIRDVHLFFVRTETPDNKIPPFVAELSLSDLNSSNKEGSVKYSQFSGEKSEGSFHTSGFQRSHPVGTWTLSFPYTGKEHQQFWKQLEGQSYNQKTMSQRFNEGEFDDIFFVIDYKAKLPEWPE
jgi:sugar lactone lactonase YvrE